MRHCTLDKLSSPAILAMVIVAAGCGGDKTAATSQGLTASPQQPAPAIRPLTEKEKQRIERDKAIAVFATFGAPQEAIIEFTFPADDGGRLLRGLLGSAGRHVPSTVDGYVAPPAPELQAASERVAFERLVPRPSVDALPAPRMLPVELKPTDRRVPQRESPPLAVSDMPRPPLPVMPAGLLVHVPAPSASAPPPLAAANRAGEQRPGPQFNPVIGVSRAVTQPAVAVGRPGPVPFDPVAIPDPLAGRVVPPLPELVIPATRPATVPRLPAPALPVTLAKSK